MANDIIVPQPSDFWTQHSKQTSLLKSTNEWLINMDKELINGILFLDLKKKIWYSESCDLSIEITNSWCDYQASNVQRIRYGVPEGSNLGPLLFSFSTLMIYLTVWRLQIHLYLLIRPHLPCKGKSSPEVKQKLNADLDKTSPIGLWQI